MQSKLAILVLMALSTLLACSAAPQSSSLCDIEEAPSHIKRVCQALESCDEMAKLLNGYLHNEIQGIYQFFPVDKFLIK